MAGGKPLKGLTLTERGKWANPSLKGGVNEIEGKGLAAQLGRVPLIAAQGLVRSARPGRIGVSTGSFDFRHAFRAGSKLCFEVRPPWFHDSSSHLTSALSLKRPAQKPPHRTQPDRS